MDRDPRLMARRPRPIRRAGSLLSAAVVVVLTACGSGNPPGSVAQSPTIAPPSASPASPSGAAPSTVPAPSADAALYQEINAQVREIRGLQERQPVTPTILSPDEMADLLRRQLDTESPPALVASYERLYHDLGVLPKDQKLSDVYVDLLTSQVAGLYVPTDKKLYVVSKAGGVGPLEKVLYSHEYTHALQDQNFDLVAFQPDTLNDQSDRQLARQALVEGDAYVTMTVWLQQHLSPAEIGVVLQQSGDQAAEDALKRIPPLVASQILFAALEGTVWALGLQTTGGFAAIDDAFKHPPDSTEQILHPDKWQSREQPIDVQLPADLPSRLGAGWSVGLQDTFGEHQLGVWISGAVPVGGLPAPPPAAAVGWGGDRMALYDGPGGSWAVVFKTEWDSPKDAAEFEAAIGPKVAAAAGPGQVLPGEGGAVRWIVIGSDDAVLSKVAGLLGLAG
ncbi:MAG TPA: hypothetical protein VFI34_04610 [Candidatus Limnocylindrales bacterium]|nr:hypothetical protein [Candidatus Limnocylindrales bacterium]